MGDGSIDSIVIHLTLTWVLAALVGAGRYLHVESLGLCRCRA